MPWEAILSATVALSVAMQTITLRMLYDLKAELAKKVDIDDHEKQSGMCRSELMSTRQEYQKRIDLRLNKTDSNFCHHSHEGLDKNSRIILEK